MYAKYKAAHVREHNFQTLSAANGNDVTQTAAPCQTQ